MPAVEEMVTTRPERWARICGSAARVTLTGPNRVVSIWARQSSGLISSKNPALKLPALFTSDVEATEPLHGCLDRGLGGCGVGDVESHGQEVLVLSEGLGDALGLAGGGDHGVAGGQGCLGDVDAQAAACAGDEPYLLLGHLDALPSADRVEHRRPVVLTLEITSANENVAVLLVRATDRDPHRVRRRS